MTSILCTHKSFTEYADANLLYLHFYCLVRLKVILVILKLKYDVGVV